MRLSDSAARKSFTMDSPGIGKKDDFVEYKTPEIEGGALVEGGAPDLYSRENIGLLIQYAAVGILYGSFPRTIYPFLNNYLYMDGFQTNAASTLVQLPWSFKVFIGIVTDSFPILGFRRRPYMVIGWAMSCIILVVMFFLPVEESFFTDYKDAGNDTLPTLIAEDLATNGGRFNHGAPGTGSKYIVLMMFASIGYVVADVAADGMVVEFAQREPEETRGTTQTMIYLTRTVFMILSNALVGFGMNGKEYGGDFSFSLTFNQISIVLAVAAGLTIPCTVIFLKEKKVERESFTKRIKEMWKIIQQRAVWQIIALKLFGGIFEYQSPACYNQVQSQWAEVTPINETLNSILGNLIMALTLYVIKNWGLGWNWRYTLIITLVLVVCCDAITSLITIYDVLRSQWFWLGVPLLGELPLAVNFIVSTYVVVEVADEGYEAMTYGLLTTVSNLSITFASTIANQIGTGFDAYKNDIATDTPYVRNQVAYNFLVSYGMRLFSLCFLVLLPPQKKEAQELKKNGGSSALAGAIFMGLFLFSLVWCTTVSLMAIYESTACLKVAGGDGC